ncbi:MAG TPA: DNA translocase FtsK 4TM domain-containing protein [bacterium]
MAERNKEITLFKEVISVLVLAAAILAGISLFSYSPSDSSFFHTGKTNVLHNYAGRVGANISALVFYVFGYAGYLFPLFLLFLSVFIIFKRRLSHPWVKFSGFAGIFLTLTGLFSIFAPATEFTKMVKGGGGFAGYLINNMLSSYFGDSGGTVILIALFIIFSIITFRLSLKNLIDVLLLILAISFETLYKYFKRFYFWARERINGILERRRRAEERKREDVRREEIHRELKDPEFVRELTESRKKPRRQKPDQLALVQQEGGYTMPPLSLLEIDEKKKVKSDDKSTEVGIQILEKKLRDFSVEGKVVGYKTGPVVTMYEYEPAIGVKINQIVNLSDDLALGLRAQSVRILAPIPGKSAVGIEIPNIHRDTVFLKEIIPSKEFKDSSSKLSLAIGKDVFGMPVVSDLAKMPHLLIAGATGSGKSICIHSVINSILYKATPDEVKFILIDPKMLELPIYDGLPHLMHEVLVDVKDASRVLKWAVREMDGRYAKLKESGAKSIDHYRALGSEDMPSIVIAIDELADLMMVVGKDVEDSITRLAQKARAAGIHLIVATQRPSVDIITGTIKANFPARIAFKVPSKTDSRTILDANGAESLLGMGDMLFMLPNATGLMRVHGSYITEKEVKRVVDHWTGQAEPEYNSSILKIEDFGSGEVAEEEADDEMYDDAVRIVREAEYASISYIQRRLRIGYNRSARMMEKMEREGIVRRVGNNKWELAAKNNSDVP